MGATNAGPAHAGAGSGPEAGGRVSVASALAAWGATDGRRDTASVNSGGSLSLFTRIRLFGIHRVLLAWVVRKLENWLGLHIWVFGIRAISPTWRLPTAHAAFRFRLLGLDEAKAAAADPAYRLDGEFVARAFRRGDLCCGAYSGERLVGYTWLSFVGASGPHGIRLGVNNPRVAYGYKTFVHPDFRGQKLNSSLVRFVEPELSRRGIEFELGYVALGNLPSMRAYFGAGHCRRLGYAVVIDWPGLFMPLCNDAVRSVVTLVRDRTIRPTKRLA